jgi:hypothetical protein
MATEWVTSREVQWDLLMEVAMGDGWGRQWACEWDVKLDWWAYEWDAKLVWWAYEWELMLVWWACEWELMLVWWACECSLEMAWDTPDMNSRHDNLKMIHHHSFHILHVKISYLHSHVLLNNIDHSYYGNSTYIRR